MLLRSNIPQIGGLRNKNLLEREYLNRKQVAVLLSVAEKWLAKKRQWLTHASFRFCGVIRRRNEGTDSVHPDRHQHGRLSV